ncbi:hypothetical protein ES702_04680 [subsurface metagenome]
MGVGAVGPGEDVGEAPGAHEAFVGGFGGGGGRCLLGRFGLLVVVALCGSGAGCLVG